MRKVISLLMLVWFASLVQAQPATQPSNYNDQLQAAGQANQTTYVMFYRANDQRTQQMANTVQAVVNANRDRTNSIQVNVTDPAAVELVKRFDATRIPLPTTFGVAPNGAVSGVFRMQVAQRQLMNAILTPKHAAMIKALQDQKITVICFQPAGSAYVPAGVDAFYRDKNFQGQVEVVSAHAGDPVEAAFFQRMNVKPNINSVLVSLYVPPGSHLGSFNENVTGEMLVSKMHKSGQCNCEKCKQNRGN